RRSSDLDLDGSPFPVDGQWVRRTGSAVRSGEPRAHLQYVLELLQPRRAAVATLLALPETQAGVVLEVPPASDGSAGLALSADSAALYEELERLGIVVSVEPPEHA